MDMNNNTNKTTQTNNTNKITLIDSLKVGDKIWIRNDLKLGDCSYNSDNWMVEGMLPDIGKEVTVSYIDKRFVNYYSSESWSLTEQMIDWDKMNRTQEEPTPTIPNILQVKFAKIHPSAIIPTKNTEDAGYDLYSCFKEDSLVIEPNTTVIIPTGLKSAYSDTHMVLAKERGSTGYKSMSLRAGVFDSGFRNEWKIMINNTGNKAILITKETNQDTLDILSDDYIIYPYSKAIAQFLFLPVPLVEIEEVDEAEIDSIPSIRGLGMLGSSGK